MYFSFRNISIAYGSKLVLDGVNLSLDRGKITSLIGANGCGKSSLLKLVTGTVQARSGEIYFKGKPLSRYKSKDLAKSIAYMPQLFHSPSDTKVEDLVAYGRFPHRKFSRSLSSDDKEIIEDAIDLCDLQRLRSRPLGELSGGEKQRARLAMTLAQGSELILLDEPTTYLDVSYQLEVLELVKRINQEKQITILMVLHDLNMASRFSDYIWSIIGPREYICGPAEDIFTTELIAQTFALESHIKYDEFNHCLYYLPMRSSKSNAISGSSEI